MVLIGRIESYPVMYDPDKDRVTCKDVTVPALKIVQAYEGSRDRTKILSNLSLERVPMGNILGCFTVNTKDSAELIKKLKRARRTTQPSELTKQNTINDARV